ncbi:MAG TPA: D-alanyl-D-alanine carboxypeptidase/D-alanyl-D-alanine-endopeptidase [Candidatus Dormibacteraeota bacterium]|jgi:PBP4 family serine-type D-alanyl-D-alanine carboxypeptidase|nr:D-alanyl-D-alanine carboxypeptidase/D-alanyl-D-alanine-endopeptidase [Candidatus Dormibacteraeota bacterium]
MSVICRTRRKILFASLIAVLLTSMLSWPAIAQETLATRIQKVMDRPEFARANFGIEFVALDTGKVIYAHDSDKLFVPASTTKLLTEGTLLAKLGADYRFHTRIYRTGPLDKKGRLKGDIVLVASGDPNLSNRIRPDGTLAFEDEDHSYGGPAVSGDPLTVIKSLAKQIREKGIRRIDGRTLIDTSLFPDGPREGGTDVVMSSIMVNDNVIDVVAKPGLKAGDPLSLTISPETRYAHFLNHATTTAAGTPQSFEDPEFAANPDGSVNITLAGTLPAGIEPQTVSIGVPSPTLFAQWVLRESLAAEGVELKSAVITAQPDFTPLAHFYTPENQIAEHVSLPLSEEIKVTLKVSQNLHAGMGPYLLGALVGKDTAGSFKKGFQLEREFLANAKLDLSGVSQGDGAGGDWADLFSPDFVCQYLAYWTTRPDYDVLFHALPVLGKDGTLAKIQRQNPGASHVFAKTGTYTSGDRLNKKMMLNGKGLAGYVITKSGRKLAFAAYVNHVSLPPDADAAQSVGGQALGEIAAAAYDAEF